MTSLPPLASTDCVDLLLVFPPQWSPFQPPLSLPSIAAWLRREGYSVRCLDLNLELYYWLFSEQACEVLRELIDGKGWSASQADAYHAIVDNACHFADDICSLRQESRGDPHTEVEKNYLAVKSLETYLGAVSDICGDFAITPYEFRLKRGNLNRHTLESTIGSPPRLLAAFGQHALAMVEKTGCHPLSVGLSCIGQEQLYFTLLLGEIFKTRYSCPVLIGGTIFSRIFERGNLPLDWFARYFDIVVRNEGESPLTAILCNLRNGRSPTSDVPSIVYSAEGDVVASPPAKPLRPVDIPIPDFDDLPLSRYISSELTLPILSSRGCYWGKCEFCHHGMVYGEKYEAYLASHVLETVKVLSERYGSRLFAFNDEAIPPKILRFMANTFPSSSDTGWNFTGLMKFEKVFREEDFQGIYRCGFRSLYVGLESGSERVLALMRKNNTQATMLSNLKDASEAGVWIHCFLFFGFPGETEEDAQQTYDFMMNNQGIIGSMGCGTFSLEHNAPIFRHTKDFGVALKQTDAASLDVYYNYEVSAGISADRAIEWMERLNSDSATVPRFRASSWIPREHLLCLLAIMPSAKLWQFGLEIIDFGGIPPRSRLSDYLTVIHDSSKPEEWVVVNRVNRRVVRATGEYGRLLVHLVEGRCDGLQVNSLCPDVIPLIRHYAP